MNEAKKFAEKIIVEHNSGKSTAELNTYNQIVNACKDHLLKVVFNDINAAYYWN